MKKFLEAALAMCLFTISALAQANTGRLVGTVSGPDGVISGVTVTITDKQTNRVRTVVTGSDGTFILPQLYFGVYTVKVTATGFKTYLGSDLKIDVGKEHFLNIALEVGDIAENVTVTAGAEVINATTAELSTTVNPRQIKDLPLNGRDPLGLIGLQAGTSSNGATSMVINGQRSSFTNITRDGVNVQDNFIRSNATEFLPDRPNIDGTGEFTIVTQNAGAEMGYGSSQVQLVTPRGGNQFHGAAYLYNRNSEFSANSFFRNSTGDPLPFLNRNQFGGSFSGPLPFPFLGKGKSAFLKDKAFFFASYEGFRLRESQFTTRTILLPQAAQGNFTYVDDSGVTRTIPLLTAAGVTTGIDPVIQSRILNNIPTVGNRTDIGDQLNTTGLSFNQLQNQDREALDTRIDFQISARQELSGVYGYKQENLLRPDADDGGYNTIPFGFQSAHTHFTSLAHRWSGSKFSNEIRGGLQKSDPTFDRTNLPQNFIIMPSLSNDPVNDPYIHSPESTFQIQGRFTGIYNIQDNAVYTMGAHSLRFGGQTQWFRVRTFGPVAFGDPTIPAYTLGTNPNTPALGVGNFPGGISPEQLDNANALLGILGGFVSQVDQGFNATSSTSGYVPGALPTRNLNYQNYSLYVSDQWRARPSLTLNFGLRYEIFSGIKDPQRLGLEPVIPQGSNVMDAILDPNGTYDFVGTNLGNNKFFNTDTNNFAPVISFAWSPRIKNKFGNAILPGDGKTVIRGGYRMSYVNDEYVRAADNALSGNQGISSTVTLNNLNARFNGLPQVSTPDFIIPRTYAQNNDLAGGFGTVFAIDPNLKTPRNVEYNIGIQREIGSNMAVEIRYVGGRSDNLVRGIDLNQIDIFNNGFLADFNRARANLLLTGDAMCGPAVDPGCQTLTVFPNLAAGGLLANPVITNFLFSGTPADLAFIYLTNGLTGTVPFLANPNTGVVDLITNRARYRYNSLQTEFRRRLSRGLEFQANYTFSKTLTDALGVGQTRFEPFLDNNNPNLEYQRADYDSTHVFNFNNIYELPFGKGRRFLDRGGLVNAVLGGWQLSSIVRISTGAPLTLIDQRGTLNRAARSGRMTPVTALTKDQVKDLGGVLRADDGVYFIDPSVINAATGRGAEGFGETPFTGQAFFNAAPGQVGNLERAILNGPGFFNLDASIQKNFRIKEKARFQFRAEAFNMLHRANFFIGNTIDINSASFGRITDTFDARVVQFVGRFEF
jgi:Carboxypeptidase regulatory-like domain